MSETLSKVNDQEEEVITLDPSTASLANVLLGMEAIELSMNRRAHLPGTVCFSGGSGLGKSVTATYVAQQYRGYYVEVRRIWNRKAFLDAILLQMGIPSDGDMPMKTKQICEQMAKSGRPLIIDEFDNVVDRKKDAAAEFLELVRDIVDGSQGSIMIIGEEKLPSKLVKYERFHNRILSWYQARPADLRDCRILAKFYYPTLTIEEKLLEAIHTHTNGRARRICVNLDTAARIAADLGKASIGLAEWGKHPFFTGEPPQTRPQ